MINREGIIISHPREDFILTLDLKTLDGMEAIRKDMMAGKTGVERYLFKGTEKIAGFAPVAATGWLIVTAAEEMSATINEISLNVSQAAAGVEEVNLNVNQTSGVASEVTQNIHEVSQASDEINTGSLQVNQSAIQLSTLAESLNTMVSNFRLN